MNTRTVLLLISLLFLWDCFADNHGKDSYIFSTIDYQQGLSNSAVISVFQDNAGLMWFGTYDGVNCYDGKEMDVYRSDISTGLTNNVIFNIQQADSNYLWITAGSGLNRFSPIRGKTVANYDIPDTYVLHSNSKGNTWLLGNDWLAYYNTRLNRFIKPAPPRMLIENPARAFVTEDGKMWVFPIAPTGEMYQFALDAFDRDTLSVKLQAFSSTFHSKSIDYIYYQNDVFCFVDADKDLYMHDISRKSTIYIRNIGSLVQKYGEIKGIVPFYKDIVIAFMRNGLIRLRTSHKYEEEIIDRNIRVFDVHNDPKQGALWVGSDGQGAVMYAKKYSIATNLLLNGLSPDLSRQVRALMTDRYGGLWFGTKGDGLIHIPDYRNNPDASKASVYFPSFKKAISSYTKEHKEFQIYTLQQSRFMDGFWVDSGITGLFYYSFKDDRLHPVIGDTLINPRGVEIHGIHEINDTTLYLATYGEGFRKVFLDKSTGQIRIKGQKQYHFYYEQRDISTFFAMVAEGDSILWLGSREKGGIVRFNKHTEEYRVISLKSLADKAADDVLCMYRFPDGRIYVGTTSGLVCLTFENNRIEAEYIGREQGLLNDMIHGILKDTNDFLWLGTNKGLIKYNPANHASHAYYYTGGVQIGEFCDGAYYKCPYSGNLFFGGIDGLLYLEQEAATAPEYYPDMLLRKLFIGRNEVNLADYLTEKGVRLKSSDNSFSLKFAVPDYVTGADVEYSCKLEGYNEEWTPFSSLTEASFSQVPVGNYVFNIRYKKDVFDTDYKHFSIPVVISPLWYQTAFARIIRVLLTVIVILYVIHLLRKYLRNARMIKEMQEMEQKNGVSGRLENLQERDLINTFTIIYQVCDELRAENISYEQRCRKVELIRETVMAVLFSSDALSDEDAKKLAPVHFTISGRMYLKELAEEVLKLFERRGEDTTRINIEIPDSFSFEVYKNALRCFFYYIYSLAFLNKEAGGITVNALEDQGKMNVILTSKDGLAKELARILSGEQAGIAMKHPDDAFQLRMLRHFVLSALGQMCETYNYEESEGGQRLTFIFPPVMTVKQSTAKKTVLLLEDRDEMVWLITGMLSGEYSIHRIKTIQSAFEFIKRTPPAVFLVDMSMYTDIEDTFMEYVNKNLPLLSKTAFIPMLTWNASVSIRQELIKWSDSHIILPYDILFLDKTLYKAVYGKQEPKQIYVEELNDFSDQIICSTEEQADFIRKFLRTVEENLDKEDLGSTFIAGQLAMSPRQFYRKFKEISGMSPGDLIKNYRMEKAARLLLKEELSIQDVISDVGIASRSYFYKEFTRKFGMTPKDYRESHKAQIG